MFRLNILICSAVFMAFTSHAQCINGNCTDGSGIFLYPSGARYEGAFKKGKINGTGILYMSTGDVYSGEWIDFYREGKGKMVFANGDVFTGSFRKSKMQGKGIMTYKNGDKYEGDWQNNLPHGMGIMIYTQNEKYAGLFYEGKKHGAGKYIYSDGSFYDGQWENDKKNGRGLTVLANGKKTNGIWQQDQLLNDETAEPNTVASTNTYKPVTTIIQHTPPTSQTNLIDCTNKFCDGVMGYYVYKDGSKYVGPFKNGNPYGKGTLHYANGDRYEGQWDDVAPHGEGVMYFTSGRVYAAIWDRGRPVKQLDQRIELPRRNDIKIVQDDEIRIWPIIVGVARYNHMPVLKYADDDAYKIYAFMKSPEGGAIPDQQIKLLIDEDATRANIIAAVQEQFGKADENDMVLMYYSGHGVTGALLPIDFDGYNNKLFHDDLLEIMEESKAKHKLCLVDACYAGSLADVKADFSTSLNKFYNRLNVEKGGTAMILSCKNREVSLEDSGLRQGIFSHYLIRGLKGEADQNSNKIVTVQELYNFIATQVKSYTGNIQNPTLEGQYNPLMPIAWIR